MPENDGNLRIFKSYFDDYYSMLCLVACDMVRSKQLAEEIVDEVFLNLWSKSETLNTINSVRAYLIKSVQNRCINWLEETKRERLIIDHKFDIYKYDLVKWSEDYPLGNLLTAELQKKVDESVAVLPDQCRNIFLLSRNEGLNYEGIASRLSISVNTVKTQMKIALSKLRESLQEYLPLLIFLLLR